MSRKSTLLRPIGHAELLLENVIEHRDYPELRTRRDSE